MPNHVIDQVARDDAVRAIGLIESHERVCTERQGNIIIRLGKIDKLLGNAFVWVVGVMGSVIAALLGMIAKGVHF